MSHEGTRGLIYGTCVIWDQIGERDLTQHHPFTLIFNTTQTSSPTLGLDPECSSGNKYLLFITVILHHFN